MRERRRGLVERHRGIRQAPEGGAVRVLPFLHRGAGDRPAAVRGERQGRQHRTRVAGARRAVQPAARYVRVALVHEERAAGVPGRVAPSRLVEVAEDDVAAAVVDLVHQDAVAPGDVDGLEDVHLEGVLDQPVRVARGVLEIHDPGVARGARIGDGGGRAEENLVRADGAERPAAEGGLAAGDVEPGDARTLGGRRRGLLRLADALKPAQPDPEYDRQHLASETHAHLRPHDTACRHRPPATRWARDRRVVCRHARRRAASCAGADRPDRAFDRTVSFAVARTTPG